MPVLKCQQCEHFFQTKLNEGATYCPKCQTTVYVPDKHDLNRGDTISGFEIVRLVGQGGMGRVYLANQTSMSRMVALKVLPKSFTQDKDAVDQFLNEVRMSGRCQHPNIVSAIDAGEADGEYYFAMAFVDGEDLDNWLEKNGVMPEEEALKYSIKIADALHYAWEKHGLFHRDIKPGNIMLNQQKEVFLLDMGIAQRIGDRAADESKSILGSPFYMSPEQAKADQLNWRTDLYSLGATLYHLIVGVPPYDDADVMKIVEKHVRAPFPEPKQRNKKTKISTHTVELIKKMMAKDADERFDSWP